MKAIHLISRTDDTVTLSVVDYEALVAAAEDAADIVALYEAETKEQEAGVVAARADHLSDEAVGRLLSGEHPITIWREHQDCRFPHWPKRPASPEATLPRSKQRRSRGPSRPFAASHRS